MKTKKELVAEVTVTLEHLQQELGGLREEVRACVLLVHVLAYPVRVFCSGRALLITCERYMVAQAATRMQGNFMGFWLHGVLMEREWSVAGGQTWTS